MKQLFVPYDLTEISLDKGFDEPCLAIKYPDGEVTIGDHNFIEIMMRKTKGEFAVKCPMYQQLVDWLGDYFEIHIAIRLTEEGFYVYEISFKKATTNTLHSGNYTSYYGALASAIKNAFSYT